MQMKRSSEQYSRPRERAERSVYTTEADMEHMAVFISKQKRSLAS